jgi:hypothetical protein
MQQGGSDSKTCPRKNFYATVSTTIVIAGAFTTLQLLR